MMPEPPPRVATLVLVDRGRRARRPAPAFPVTTPWWQDMEPLVAACRERFGFRPTVLRLLSTERGVYPGGGVTYLAEVGAPEVAAVARVRSSRGREPWTNSRCGMPWARAGGPTADLAWADEAAGRRGTPA